MQKVEHGELDTQVDVKRRDEFGQLADGFNHLTRRLRKLVDSVGEARRQESEARIRMLLGQINPHFLYNTLDSIRMMAILEDQDKIAQSLEELADFFRYTVRQTDAFVTVREELGQIERYAQLQILRTGQVRMEYRVPGDVPDCRIPKFLLQPLVENAILHGLADTESGGVIRVEVRREGGRLQFSVADNGCGYGRRDAPARARRPVHAVGRKHGAAQHRPAPALLLRAGRRAAHSERARAGHMHFVHRSRADGRRRRHRAVVRPGLPERRRKMERPLRVMLVDDERLITRD